MAEAEFWLPSEFLEDDFIFSKMEDNNNRDNKDSESDEEEYLAGLTQQMTQTFLHDNDYHDYPKIKAGAKSPQSTLCDVGIWSGSNMGSPNGSSEFSSPPKSPYEQNRDDAWDLLTAAAGQVVRLKLTGKQQQQQPSKFHGRGLLGPPINTQLQAERFYQLQQQQLMKQQMSAAWAGRHQNRGKSGGGGRAAPLGLPSSAWPPLQKQQQQQQQQTQQQPGSGMRAVFLTGSGTRESTGTGVFLPRRRSGTGIPSDSRKKPACSTVLLPDRVIQALNLNLDDMGGHPRFPGGYVLDHDAMVARGNSLASQQKQNHYRPSPFAAAATNHDLRLPAEWTY